MVIDISKISIREYEIPVKGVEVEILDSEEFCYPNILLEFESIEDVKAFILELWEVAKETWPNA